ncbi:MAG: hypothetical protein R6V62_00225 [Candidatus Fermentibacteraceae bacterium]
MDSTLKQMLDGLGFSIRNYESSLGPRNGKLIEAKQLLDGLVASAESGADMAGICMDPGFAQVAALIGELASEPPLPARELEAMKGESEAVDGIPPAAVAAAGYHMAFDSLPPGEREKQKIFYDRVFELERQALNALHFNTLLMEDTVLLDMSRIPLRDAALATLEQAESIFSPTVNFQQRLAASTYERVSTLTELEFEGTKMAALSNTEHQWDSLYIEVIGLLPACAQAIESFGPNDDSIAKLKNSHRFMAGFMGITWDDVFSDPRYLLFWNNVFWPRIPGEKRLLHNVTTPEGWRDTLKTKFYDPFVKDEPPLRHDPEKARVRFRGREYSSGETLDVLNDPPRPNIDWEPGLL